MKINDAIAKRINDLCNDKDLAYKLNKSDNLSTNKLASLSYITQSTAQHLTDGRSKNPKMLTIARISNGFGLKLKDFFDDATASSISSSSLLQQVYKLSPKQQEALIAFIEAMTQTDSWTKRHGIDIKSFHAFLNYLNLLI